MDDQEIILQLLREWMGGQTEREREKLLCANQATFV